MRDAASLGSFHPFTSEASTVRQDPSHHTLHPSAASSTTISSTSRILGQPSIRLIPSWRMHPAIIGKTAFFDPCILTHPSRGFPPQISTHSKPKPPPGYLIY